MKIEIKSRVHASVLFAHEEENNSILITLEAAVSARANLAGANLADANQVIDAGIPNGWRTVGWLREGRLSVRVGCRDKRLAEGREYWAGKSDRREVLAALDYVEAIARLRGWEL